MPVGIYHTLNVAKWTLLVHQKAIETIGHNVSNANTEGYSRQVVELETAHPISVFPGQIGSGVKINRIKRLVDENIEKRIAEENPNLGRFSANLDILEKLQDVFSKDEGSFFQSIEDFWSAWNNLSQNPESEAVRKIVIEKAETLTGRLRQAREMLTEFAKMAYRRLKGEVEEINSIAAKIAELNQKIAEVEVSGNAANDYRDRRDLLLKKLSEKIPINYFEGRDGKIDVLTKWGKPLVEGIKSFELKISDFSGEIGSSSEPRIFWGSEDVTDRIEGGTLKGYLDAFHRITGKKTLWGSMEYENVSLGFKGFFWGKENSRWSIKPIDANTLKVTFEDGTTKNLDLSFIPDGGSYSFYLKDGIYLEVSKKGAGDAFTSEEVSEGKSMAVSFEERGYIGELDRIARTLIEKVNLRHAPGAGIDNFERVEGTTYIPSDTVPLNELGLDITPEAGSFTIKVFDSSGNEYDVTITYNPTDTLADIINQINASGYLTASLSSGHLIIQADSGYTFSLAQGDGQDDTNLIAALGLNNFFEGNSAQDIYVSQRLQENPRFIAAAFSPNSPGDNRNALSILNLQHEKIIDEQTLDQFIGKVSSELGEEVKSAQSSKKHEEILISQLKDYRERISGVSLDEEMAELIKFQYNFAAAARIITVVDELLTTILSIGR